MDELIQLRHHLHQHPELSGCEAATADRIARFLQAQHPHHLLRNVGGHGVVAIYEGQQPGPTVLLRCDMDAVPVHEQGQLPHRSLTQGVAHSCGHDGHMAIVAGLAMRLQQTPPQRGRVMLLFQPAEETGQGAAKVVAHLEAHPELRPTYAIGLHNLPQMPLGQVLLRHGTFAAASKGIIINLKGKNSHAAHPERGINPSAATAQLMQQLLALPQLDGYNDFVLCTLVHVRVGEVAFGTSAGEAVLMATLRAFSDADMHLLSSRANEQAQQIALLHGLGLTMSDVEAFPATVNAPELVQLAEQACLQRGIDVAHLPQPNRWSEDFAHYARLCPSLLLGLGAGVEQPALHTPEYDFPDALIAHGVAAMEAIARRIVG